MLTIKDLALTYPDGTEALRGIDLRLEQGVFGLLGPNGAGKSTLMQLLATLLRPSRGTIGFAGIDVLAQPQSLRRLLGYLPQDFGVYPNVSALHLLDHLVVLKGVVDRAERHAETERLLRLVNLWDVRARAVASFSGGMRQRFGVAQALIGRPQLIIVDEPTAGLDPEERNRLYDVLVQVAEAAVVIISTHIIEDIASLCSRLGVLARGQLLFTGTPDELIGRVGGRIWVSTEEPRSGQILSSRLQGGQRRYRVLGEHPPGPEARQAEALLEDGYLAALKEAA
jgi:ABC-type multidrug transport system ATPase subunit